jgi:hypothetical protein
MKMSRFAWIFLGASLLISGCEEEFEPSVSTEDPEIVVEGYIEAGERPLPPYVILTRSVPFFAELQAKELEDIFVHGAAVTVSDRDQEVRLSELCLSELNAEELELAGRLIGRDLQDFGFNFCAYVDLSGAMRGETGKRYDLLVQVEGRTLQASTVIPPHSGLDSVRFVEPPGEPTVTLAQLRCFIRDPAGQQDFYRYFTGINDGPLQTGLNSVIDDRLFDGQEFEFPLLKAEPRNSDFDPETFGLFRLGDTVTLKWANIDEAHYDFWNTLEFNAANQGPFSSYTRVASNVSGGLGIWGGLSASYYTRIVQK